MTLPFRYLHSQENTSLKKTFEALAGAKHAVVHLYNSTSVAQREQVFRKPKNEIIDIAVEGAKLLKEYREKTPGDFEV